MRTCGPAAPKGLTNAKDCDMKIAKTLLTCIALIAIAGCISLPNPFAGKPTETVSLFDGAPPAPAGYADYEGAQDALATGKVPRVKAPENVPAGIAFYDNVPFSIAGGEILTLDIYVPRNAETPPPMVLMIHGGGWRKGKKEDEAVYTIAFAEAGYATASVDYRLTPKHTFPAAIHDVKCAMVWLKDHGKAYGFDGKRMVLMGGSAGGHLSLLAAYSQDPKLACPGRSGKDEPEVMGIVNVYGVVDCTTPVAQGAHQVQAFIGKPYSEAAETYAQSSPIHHLDKNDPPTLTFHGTVDELVPISQADTLHERLAKLGITNHYDRVEGWHHSMDLAEPVNERICFVTKRFLATYLPLQP